MFDITATIQAIQSLFESSGYFPSVIVGEPKDAPSDMTIAIFMMDIEEPATTLSGTIEVYGMMARIYGGKNIFDPMENLELGLAKAVSKALSLLAGSFTLGGTVRAIDWSGEEGGGKVGVKWGHGDVSGVMMRLADLSIPVIVDDSATFAP